MYDFNKVIDRKNTNSVKYDLWNYPAHVSAHEDFIPMWIADMDFEVACEISESIKKVASHGIFGYTNRPDTYFDAVIAWQKKYYNLDINRDLMEFSPSVMTSISYLVSVLTVESDKILIQTPVYSEFMDTINLWKRQVVENTLVETEHGYTVDFEDFESKIKQGVKVFILCNPHNPVGKVFTKEELTKMADICVKYQVKVISDEIHSDLIFKGHHTMIATLNKEIEALTYTCFSASKTFNLAGLQASQLVFPNIEEKQTFFDYLSLMQIKRNSATSVVATEAAYTYGRQWLDELLVYLQGNIDFVDDFFKTHIPQIKFNIPDATYMLWLDCRALGMSEAELIDLFVNQAHVVMNVGSSFGSGGTGFFRMNVATSRHTLERALKQIQVALENRKDI